MYGYFLQPTQDYPIDVLNLTGHHAASWLGAGLIFVSIIISALGTHRHVPELRTSRTLEVMNLKVVSGFETFLIIVILSLLASMIADIVEDVQKQQGIRHEGAGISAQTFIGKLSVASSIWLAGILLTAIELPDAALAGELPADIVFALGFSNVAVFFTSILVGVAFLLQYKLDSKTHEENLALIT
jgi:Na+/melibiose symporter-like transporter